MTDVWVCGTCHSIDRQRSIEITDAGPAAVDLAGVLRQSGVPTTLPG